VGISDVGLSISSFWERDTPVKKWTTVDKAFTPDGKTISLHEHDGSYTIRVDGAQLMSTRQHASEEKLAELACAHVRSVRGARVLIGGLGFGFTLKAALSAVAPDATVVMAEILAAVIAWNSNPAFHLAAKDMADPRVMVLQQDVGEVIRQARAGFDSIILDVDNGPAALSTAGNGRLYDHRGLQLARIALRPAGCLAFWSAAPDPAFERRMIRAGFTVDVRRSQARANSGARHTLFLGRVK
jgi:spermidine synthase